MTKQSAFRRVYEMLWTNAQVGKPGPKGMSLTVKPSNSPVPLGKAVPLQLTLEYPNDLSPSYGDHWYTYWFFFRDHKRTTSDTGKASTKSNIKVDINTVASGSKYGAHDFDSHLPYVWENTAYKPYRYWADAKHINLGPGGSPRERLENNGLTHIEPTGTHAWSLDDYKQNWKTTEFPVLVQAFLLSYPPNQNGFPKNSNGVIRVGSTFKMVKVENTKYDKNDPRNYTFQINPTKALNRAERLHKKYVKAEQRYIAFTHAVDTSETNGSKVSEAALTRRKRRVALWTVVSNVLNGLQDDLSNRHKVIEKIGLNASDYDDDYFELYLEPYEKNINRLDFELDLKTNATISEILGFGESNDNDTPYWKDLQKTAGNVADDAPEFITFGRKVYGYRADYERATHELIAYLKGRDPGSTYWEGAPSMVENQFNFALQQKPYEQQVRKLATVFDRLARTESGQLFLGELFLYRDRPGMINPMNVLNPKKVTAEEKKKWRTSGGIISVENSRYGKFFDSNGQLRIYSNSTPEARTVARSQEKLGKALSTGLATYVNMVAEGEWDDPYGRDAQAVAMEYHTKFLGTLIPWQDLKQLGFKKKDVITTRNPKSVNKDDLGTTISKVNTHLKTVAVTA